MSKTNELSQTMDELRNAAKLLLSVADALTDLFSGTGGPPAKANKTTKPPAPKEKAITLETVRAVLVEKSRNGFTDEVKSLVEKYGAARLSEVNPKEYPGLLEEAKVLGNG